MSVKGKVKRLNKEIIKLQDMLETERISNKRLRSKLDNEKQNSEYVEQLESILKFTLINSIGHVRGGMQFDRYEVEKMKDLRLSIDYELSTDSYITKIDYKEKICANSVMKRIEKI